MRYSIHLTALFFTLSAFSLPSVAHAYIGPGAGLGAIATTLTLVLGIVLLVMGLVWYPLKRLFKGKKTAAEHGERKEMQKK